MSFLLPSDRSGCLLHIRALLQERLADVTLVLGAVGDDQALVAYARIVEGELAFIRNLLALIERG